MSRTLLKALIVILIFITIGLLIFVLSSKATLTLWTEKEDYRHKNFVANNSDPVIKTIGGKVKTPEGINVSNAELERLSEDLFNKDVNNAWGYIWLNLQNETTKNSSIDRAPEPLLTVYPDVFKIPTINRLVEMYDNYDVDNQKPENMTSAHSEEQDRLLDAFLETDVMSTAMKFLSDNNYLPKNEFSYKDTLKTLWFSLYGTTGANSSSSAFEHVFMSELKRGGKMVGLHSWIYFNSVESKKEANYLGYWRKIDLGDKAAILDIHCTFKSHNKQINTILIGTSPELEMALYTICFYTRTGQECKLSFGGSKFRIIVRQLTFKGKTFPGIGTALPLI